MSDMNRVPVELHLLDIEPQQQSALHHQLTTRGFALINVRDRARTRALNQGLETAAELSGFRFPPINVDEVRYAEPHREAFRALYATALECLMQLDPDMCRDVEGTQRLTQEALRQPSSTLTSLSHLHPELFSASPHEPFPADHPFHPTFFNLFNYDHGALNGHKDRGLLTIIYIKPAAHNERQEASALWVANAEGSWMSADHELSRVREEQAPITSDHQVILLIGEEGEEAFRSTHPHLFAAEHSVRVSPIGDYIERSHYLRDPTSREDANRLSAALILQRR